MTAKQRIGLAGLLSALALFVPSAALAASPPGVKVIGEENALLATFKTAKCKTKKPKGVGASFLAKAISTNGQYELSADVFQPVFNGFHKYDLTLEPDAKAVLYFSGVGGSGTVYSNEFVPSFPVPGFGQIRFTNNGSRVGIGFAPAMWSQDLSTAVVLAGGLECRYASKPKR